MVIFPEDFPGINDHFSGAFFRINGHFPEDFSGKCSGKILWPEHFSGAFFRTIIPEDGCWRMAARSPVWVGVLMRVLVTTLVSVRSRLKFWFRLRFRFSSSSDSGPVAGPFLVPVGSHTRWQSLYDFRFWPGCELGRRLRMPETFIFLWFYKVSGGRKDIVKAQSGSCPEASPGPIPSRFQLWFGSISVSTRFWIPVTFPVCV